MKSLMAHLQYVRFGSLAVHGAVCLALGEATVWADTNRNVFVVYSDAGIPPPPAVLYTWHDPACSPTYNAKYADLTAPEGTQSFRTSSRGRGWVGWGIFTNMDMSDYISGEIRFFLKSTNTLQVDLEDMDGYKAGTYGGPTANQWQEVSLPMSRFARSWCAWVDLSRIYGLFLITSLGGPTTFYVDDVRWIGHPGPKLPLVIRTNGICPAPPDTVVLREPGQPYIVTPRQYAGYVFSGWSDGTGRILLDFQAELHSIPLFLPIDQVLFDRLARLPFVMESNLVLVANYVSTVKPTLKITTPTPRQRVGTAEFAAAGTVKGNACLQGVRYRLNDGPWQDAALGASNWVARLTLVPGANTLRAYALDGGGNVSLTNRVSFTYVLSAPVVVGINGQGSARPNYNGQLLEIGRTYSMTAVAGAGNVFSNWTGSVRQSKRTMTFVAATNLVFTAN